MFKFVATTVFAVLAVSASVDAQYQYQQLHSGAIPSRIVAKPTDTVVVQTNMGAIAFPSEQTVESMYSMEDSSEVKAERIAVGNGGAPESKSSIKEIVAHVKGLLKSTKGTTLIKAALVAGVVALLAGVAVAVATTGLASFGGLLSVFTGLCAAGSLVDGGKYLLNAFIEFAKQNLHHFKH